METDERHQDNPTTPIEQTTQETPRLIIQPPLNKRPAAFSPEITTRERNPFQNSQEKKPRAKDSTQAIFWARDLILQASTMAESHLSQNKLLQLLDVFRDFTELGRVTQQMTEKFTAQLAYQTATLTSASQQATKTLKKAVNAATGPQNPNNQENQTTRTPRTSKTPKTPKTPNKTRHHTLAVYKKKTNKKPASYYQAVLTLTQPTSHTPLQIRDLINEEFKGRHQRPREYLVQHKHIWHQKFELKNVQLLESWTKVVVHNVPTEWEGAETLEILHTEIPAYNNGLQITGNPYWISREWQNKKNSSIVIAFKTAEDAARLGGRITILGQTLFTENH
ncbi:uncharacterized protein PtrM4_152510 [Pyrenophora tritici-repentis]|uniref:Uncharacterized protein n=1 Tax=Pyrenophora tritici-repentis TaxID=45151 RepID=A0A834RLM5_9PLEO|nr:hypothetical protein PtrM4_152510 [Pyrenophora tritici-repentis]